MTSTNDTTHPYTLEVSQNPRAEGAWHWAIRRYGKMVERSDRALPSEMKAQARGLEHIEKLLHSFEDRPR